MKTKQTNIRLSEQAQKNLTELSAKTGINKTALIEMAIMELAQRMAKK